MSPMAAPFTGTANAPDVPANPIPAATSIADKVVRIVISPPIVILAAWVDRVTMKGKFGNSDEHYANMMARRRLMS